MEDHASRRPVSKSSPISPRSRCAASCWRRSPMRSVACSAAWGRPSPALCAPVARQVAPRHSASCRRSPSPERRGCIAGGVAGASAGRSPGDPAARRAGAEPGRDARLRSGAGSSGGISDQHHDQRRRELPPLAHAGCERHRTGGVLRSARNVTMRFTRSGSRTTSAVAPAAGRSDARRWSSSPDLGPRPAGRVRLDPARGGAATNEEARLRVAGVLRDLAASTAAILAAWGALGGALTSDTITETDIIDGRWDNASVEVWRANWSAVGQRVLMRRGAIGQVRRGRLAFVAEVRSLAHVLNQTDSTNPENVNAEAHAADIVDRPRPAAGLCAERGVGVARGRLVRRRPPRRALPHPPGRRGQRQVGRRRRTGEVDGVGRGSAHLVSRDAQNRPAYSGTPSDAAVVQAIQELKTRGLPRHLLSVHPDGCAGRQRAAGPVLEPRERYRPAGLPWCGRIYASAADREAQNRTPITDGAQGRHGLPVQGHPLLVVEPPS